jgi:lipopolysaccharide assembly outer membrane protein LptD (OstA)
MKRFALLVLCIALVTPLAKTQSDGGGLRDRSDEVRKLVQEAHDHGYATHEFMSINSEVTGPFQVHLKGRVRIRITDKEILAAEEADYQLDTGRIDARGNVSVTLLRDVDPRAWSQFGMK